MTFDSIGICETRLFSNDDVISYNNDCNLFRLGVNQLILIFLIVM